jgi:hypothetical protein
MSAPTFPISLSKEVSNVTATSGTWTLTLSDVDGIIAGMKFDLGGFTTPAWNVTAETVDSVDQTNKTVTYTHGNATVASQEAWAQFHLECTWITLEDLEAALGYEFDAGDTPWAEQQVDASNDWAYRTRSNAGYQDHPNYAPSSDVKQGVVLYAAQLVKQRGAVDGYASFENQSFGQAPGQSYAQILQLLGCKRPQVG